MEHRIADLHIHSSYSADSWMSPRTILSRARRAGLSLIAITDHGTIRGALEAQRLAPSFGMMVVLGTEIRTDRGDLIGLGITGEIQETGWEDTIRAIRSQGGVAVLPHPYRGHDVMEELAREVDLIEVWNGRCTSRENRDALDLARRTGRGMLLGSDAHMPSEIGRVKFRLEVPGWRVGEVLRAEPASRAEIGLSVLTARLKRHLPRWR